MKKRGIFKFVMLNGGSRGAFKKLQLQLQVQVQNRGRRPTPTWGAAYRRHPPRPPGLFHCALPLAGYVSAAAVIAAKPRRCAVPFVRVTTRAKDARFFTSPPA